MEVNMVGILKKSDSKMPSGQEVEAVRKLQLQHRINQIVEYIQVKGYRCPIVECWFNEHGR